MGRKGGRKKFAGKNMHLEFHTVKPKKKKAADCIYLTENRECQNKKSPDYLSKCFAASYCTFKVRSKDIAPPPKPIAKIPTPPKKEEPKIIKIKCTLPLNCRVSSPIFGKGRYTAYYEEGRIIEVTFQDKPRKFVYPDAILDKYLFFGEFADEIVARDIAKAEKG